MRTTPTAEAPDLIIILTDRSVALRGAIDVIRTAFGLNRSVVLTDYRHALQRRHALGSEVLILNPFGFVDTKVFDDVVRLCAQYRVLAFGSTLSDYAARQLARLGVRGHVAWSSPAEVLVNAILEVASGTSPLRNLSPCALLEANDPALLPESGVPNALMRGTHSTLTRREQQVLRSIASGMTHKEIAGTLTLSKTTVDTYVQRLRRKLGVRNKAELTAIAYRFGLLEGTEPESKRPRAVSPRLWP